MEENTKAAQDSVVKEDSTGADDQAALQARIAQLEAENEALKRSSAELAEVATVSSGKGRNFAAISLAIIAALLIALAVPALWLNRMVSDTDVYVETVAPLADDPDIQNAVAAAATDALVEKIDAETRLKEVLPENLQILAIPVSQAVNSFVGKQATTFVQSDQFGTAWETMNRVSHNAMVTAVTGRDTGAVGIEAGTITLDVGTLAEEIKARLLDSGFELAAKIPTSGIDKQITLYESPALAQASVAFDLMTRLAMIIPLLGLAFAAGAIGIAANRRRALLWLGAALTIAAILPLQALYLAQTQVTAQLYQLAAIPQPAAESAFNIIFRDLVAADQAVIALGIVLWLSAIVAGPARWAVALREGLSGGMSGVASHLALGKFGEWVQARKKGLRGAGIVGALAILLMLPAPRTVSSVLWLAFGYLVWLLLVELFGATPAESSVASEAPPEETAESA